MKKKEREIFLPTKQKDILNFVDAFGSDMKVESKEISHALGFTFDDTVDTINILKARGFITKEFQSILLDDGHSRELLIVHLTEKGKQILKTL